MTAPLTMESVVVASSEQVHRQLGDEAVILSLGKGIYYGIDGVGTFIWSRVQQPVKVADLLAALLEEYEVEAERGGRDLLDFLNQLLEQSLIEPVTA